jgi:DNA polymerase III delta prime subunit
MERHVFPGGNTARGFHSFYEYIAGPDIRRIFVLKGGPGVGKSTFMRAIARELLSRGLPVEFHHCSADNGSLDGLVAPSLGVALIDGTAPQRVVTVVTPGGLGGQSPSFDTASCHANQPRASTILSSSSHEILAFDISRHFFDMAFGYDGCEVGRG